MKNMNTKEVRSFDIEDLDVDVLPGGASEPVLHVGAVIVVIGILYSVPAY